MSIAATILVSHTDFTCGVDHMIYTSVSKYTVGSSFLYVVRGMSTHYIGHQVNVIIVVT